MGKAISVNLKLTNKSKNEATIMAVVSYGAYTRVFKKKRYEQINVYFSGCRVPISAWNNNLKLVEGKEHEFIAMRVIKAQLRLKWICELLMSQNRLSKTTLVDFLNSDIEWSKIFNKEVKKSTGNSISEFIRHWITNQDNITKGTKYAYSSLAKHIDNFSRHKNAIYTFENFTQKDFLSFVKYLQTHGLNQSTIYTQFVVKLKRIFKIAEIQDIDVYKHYANFKIEKPTIDNSNKRLTDDEIIKLENMELNDKLSWFRYCLLFECYTGIRMSDYDKATKENIKDQVLYFIPRKTIKYNSNCIVPLQSKAIDILEKYDYKLYRGKTFEKFKQMYVKGLNEISKLGKFSNKLTSHRGRHTFVSKCKELGISDENIMKATGHKSLSSFNIYNNPDKEIIGQKLKAVFISTSVYI